jgi:protein-L-isoaspartate(D-aspartate) O-methyltransferase
MKNLILLIAMCLAFPLYAQEAAPVTEEQAAQEMAPPEAPPEAPVEAPAEEPAPESASVASTESMPSIPTDWTYARYEELMQTTERKSNTTEATWDAVRKRKEKALERIKKYLEGKFTTADEEVMAAFATVPREYFHFNYEAKYSSAGNAYEADAKPWGVGYGSALSDYLGQAYMTQLADPKPGEVALEIGTGSGFQSSLLSRICDQVYTIEIIEPLGNQVTKVIAALGYDNVHVKVGDGYFGWPEVEGGFDIIMVTCAARYVPPALLEQLKPGGRLLIPVGPPIRGRQVLFVYTKDEEGRVKSRRDTGVYFIPMTGAMLEEKQ